MGELDRLRVTHTAMAASVLHSRPERGRRVTAPWTTSSAISASRTLAH
ncbi:hypothetical protein [Streptomyces sp. NPDC051001]